MRLANRPFPRPRLGALVASLALALCSTACPATLEVAVHGVRSARGFVRVAVCGRATFLTENCEYFADAPAVAGTTTLRVRGVTPGAYAIQVFHDDTGGGVIHRGIFGIPREGIGFSNDAKLHIRGPRFDEAAVVVAEPIARTSLGLRYLRPTRDTALHPESAPIARR